MATPDPWRAVTMGTIRRQPENSEARAVCLAARQRFNSATAVTHDGPDEHRRPIGLAAPRRATYRNQLYGAFSWMSSTAGPGWRGIELMVCSARRGPTPYSARRSMIGANMARSMESCWI